jgi:hypothetical protein
MNNHILPFSLATALSFLVLLSQIGSGMPGNTRIIVVDLLIWLIWLVVFQKEQMTLKKKLVKTKHRWIVYFSCIIIVLFCVNRIWFSGVLNLNLIEAISNASIHRDTTLWASIAESIKNYGYPDMLMNNPKYFHFHTGSEFIVAILSMLFQISVLNIYNFIIPVLCLPVYAYLIINVIIEIRKYKKESTVLSKTDYFFLVLFYVGFLPEVFLDRIGIWKGSVIAQEAYLFAQIFFLVYFHLLLKILNSDKLKEKTKEAVILAVTPIFIFLCSFMKISVGFLLTVGVMYFIFRKHTQKLKYWGINIFYFIVFVVSFLLFNEATGNTPFHLLDFVLRYARQAFPVAAICHYIILLFFMLLFLGVRVTKYNALKTSWINKELLIEETSIVFAGMSLVPGMLLYIPGGSAGYFSYLQELVAIILVLGFNIGNYIKNMFGTQCKSLRLPLALGLLIVIMISTLNSGGIYAFFKVPLAGIKSSQYFTSNKSLIKTRIEQKNVKGLFYDGIEILFSKSIYLETTFIKNMYELANIPFSGKKQHIIYIDENAEIWDKFKKDKNHIGVHLYQAFTGIRVINAIYTDGEHIYTSVGTEAWGVFDAHYAGVKTIVKNKKRNVEIIPKVPLEKAMAMAKDRNIKYFIYVYKNTYQIIEL